MESNFCEIVEKQPNHYCVAIGDKCESTACSKSGLSVLRTFMLSVVAGLFIGAGGLFMLVVKADSSLGFACSQVLGGLCFSLGLISVFVAGAELFTGNSLMITAALSKKISWKSVLRNWVIVYIGNLCGSLLFVMLVFIADISSNGAGQLGNAMINTAVVKVSLSPEVIFVRGILCNFLVCLAVWMGLTGTSIVDKAIASAFPVMAFVSCGFEHCVANMFLLPIGLAVASSGFVYTGVADLSVLNIVSVVSNIGLATVGNIIGGAIMIGCFYWLAYKKG